MVGLVRDKHVVCGIDGRMWRYLEEQQLTCTGEQDIECWPGMMLRRQLRHKVMDHRLQLPEAAQRLGCDRDSESCIA